MLPAALNGKTGVVPPLTLTLSREPAVEDTERGAEEARCSIPPRADRGAVVKPRAAGVAAATRLAPALGTLLEEVGAQE